MGCWDIYIMCLSVCLSVCLFVYLSICLSIYLSICLSVCLYIYPHPTPSETQDRHHHHPSAQLWRQRCCATGERLGTGSVFVLTRWDRRRPPAVDNLLLLRSAAMADAFDVEVGELSERG